MIALSLTWGILAIVCAMIGFLPFLGFLNWIIIPFAFLGIILSALALTTVEKEAKKTGAVAGMVCCIFVVFFSAARLFVGCGIF